MSRSRLAGWLIAAVAVSFPSAVEPAAPVRAPVRPADIQLIDNQRRIDGNQLNMWATNFGSFAWDLSTGNSGLEYPKGSGKTAIFAAGLWLGARVGGQVRTVVAEYSQEYGPGSMVGGTFDNPNKTEYVVYKVVPWTGDPLDLAHVARPAPGPTEDPLAHHSWSEYNAGAAPYGAPTRTWDVNGSMVLGPDVRGDQMLWAVYNDADPARHTNDAGGSTPLGVEIQQTTWCFNQSDYRDLVIFLEFKIINKGGNLLEDMYISLWSDVDLGGFTDDLVGCDPSLDLGYVYNASNNDLLYGGSPPAAGFVVLQGPVDPGGTQLGMTAFSKYIGGTDPASTLQTYNYMQGLMSDGSPVIDPTTGLQTTFFNPGDPVQGTGWLDSNPADRRMMLSSGPIRMAPGETQVVRYAIVVGQGSDRLSSINALKAGAVALRGGPPPPPPPPPPTNCPRAANFWEAQCGPSGGDLTPQQVADIATYVNGQSLLFDWAQGSESESFCATLSPSDPSDLRAQAKREFAALLANYVAGPLGIEEGGLPIRLLPNTPITCPGLDAVTMEQLVETSSENGMLRDVAYLDNNPLHRRALTGVNWGGRRFFGGADTGWYFWGGTLDSDAMPDSFFSVEIRFDSSNPQMGYRYLRLERADGSSPATGREYRYGGFHPSNLSVWDMKTNTQLEYAWVERTVTDAAGTIQPPAAQVATFDSTWAPTVSSPDLGGREYFFVLRTPYSGTPRAEFMVDDAMDNAYDFLPGGTQIGAPILYAMWVGLRLASDVIDDGDAMDFIWSRYAGRGIDSRLLALELESLSDPGVQQAYADLIQCMSNINLGIGLENPCDMATPVLASLVSATADPDHVTLAWSLSEPSLRATIERRTDAHDWAQLATVLADGTGMIRFEDREVTPGRRYGYRLAFLSDGRQVRAGEAWVEVPAIYRLALTGFVPNPALSIPAVEMVLPSRDPARLEVFDLLGRRLAARDVGALGPGRVVVPLDGPVTLRPGIYLLTLTQGSNVARQKAVLLR